MFDKFQLVGIPKRQACKIPAMYVITHVASGRVYVGSTTDIAARRSHHEHYLRRGKHDNGALQQAYNEDPRIKFHCVLTHTVEEARKYEQEMLDMHHSSGNLFNISTNVERPQLGLTHSEETRKRLSETTTAYMATPEAKEKLRVANFGRKASLETLEKMRAANLGKTVSVEVRQKRRESNQGRMQAVKIDGVVYPSARDAGLALNVSVDNVRARCRRPGFPNWEFYRTDTDGHKATNT